MIAMGRIHAHTDARTHTCNVTFLVAIQVACSAPRAFPTRLKQHFPFLFLWASLLCFRQFSFSSHLLGSKTIVLFKNAFVDPALLRPQRLSKKGAVFLFPLPTWLTKVFHTSLSLVSRSLANFKDFLVLILPFRLARFAFTSFPAFVTHKWASQ